MAQREIEELEDLIHKQQRALEMADDIIKLKDQLLELTEKQVDLYKESNKRLTKALLISTLALIVVFTVSLTRSLA